MIEIVLREDIESYEPSAFFGMTRRQLVMLLIGIVFVGGTATCGVLVGVPVPHLGWVLIVEGLLIGFIGIKRFGKLPAEKYVAIAFEEFCLPKHLAITTPVVIGAMDRKESEIHAKRKRKRAKEKE